MHSIRMTAALTLSAALAAITPCSTTAAELEVVHAFDPAAQELPEGLSLDPTGNAYVTLGHPFWFAPGDGWIKRVGPDGTGSTLAHFEAGQGPAGIMVGADGSTYFAWPDPGNPDTTGVYRLDADGTSTRLPGSEASVLAIGLARDGQGVLCASITGSVRPANESPLAITLVQAIGRGERMDFALQKATELGVARIQPITSERAIRRNGS